LPYPVDLDFGPPFVTSSFTQNLQAWRFEPGPGYPLQLDSNRRDCFLGRDVQDNLVQSSPSSAFHAVQADKSKAELSSYLPRDIV